jgi:predicted ester cyclase
MRTRRTFLKNALGAGAGLVVAARQPRRALAQTESALDRNKSVVRRYKEAMNRGAATEEFFAPGYKRLRAGLLHLGDNARDQGFRGPGAGLRDAIPDRMDVIEEIVADGDKVGMLWRLTGTHKGELYGIPPTGRKIDIYELGILRLANDKIAEGWFMADEAGLLRQLGAGLPPRKDRKLIVPEPLNTGEDPDIVLRRLKALPAASVEDRNKLVVASSKTSAPASAERTPDYRQRRFGFQHLRDYGVARGVAEFNITRAFPDRRDRIDDLLAEGDKVWMHFELAGTHSASLYGLPPTGRRVEAPEIGIMRIVDGKWKDSWYFGDELGLLLQLDALQVLRGLPPT